MHLKKLNLDLFNKTLARRTLRCVLDVSRMWLRCYKHDRIGILKRLNVVAKHDRVREGVSEKVPTREGIEDCGNQM